ncbi:MAG: glutamine--fructose-6-phosphate transaminase (isomerizing) [Candidatus Heimdallarchaeota archaeon]|nr:glutamine--fructose-6-phosphate transaminase (isomerizing) [Candidatus Heimdallarchaeota archaeon]MDH5646096.1 glutamine--fructose-6-phosphate transaminase (isomerizing) [Candidatus Heimdallarchaeota archaeon]
MCGIIGITKNKPDKIGHEIFDALTRLEYRGYDSVGMALISSDGISVLKDKGNINDVGHRLNFKEIMGSTAIGHSRWATHGPPNQINAHPHSSNNGKVVVIHNGIIENFMEIKSQLIRDGFTFISQTDTEVIPHYLSKLLDEGKTMYDAIVSLTQLIKGTYALVIASTTEPNRIYALKKDNPLVIGITDNEMYCASDIPAFLPFTRDVVILRDNELAILEPGKFQIKLIPSGKEIKRKPHEISWTAEAAQKGGFPHFMLKEIHSQPEVMKTQLKTQDDVFSKFVQHINQSNKVVLVAAGTAHYASLVAYHTIPEFSGKIVVPCIASEWETVSHIIDSNSVVIAVSQSGETLDTIKAIKDAKKKGAKILSVVNVTGSTLTTISDEVIYIHSGPEIGVAATKTFTSTALAIWRIAKELAISNGKLSEDELEEFTQAIERMPEAVKYMVAHSEAKSRDLAKWFATKKSAFYLGRGAGHIIALEGALKMKEISYVHAEAYPGGESKHGPIALVEDDYPVVFAIPNDNTRVKMMGSVQEMSARGAITIGVIEEGDEEMKEVLSHYFEVPRGFSRFCSTIPYSIPMQLMAYYTSCAKDYDPDKPRNLAKSVTVE